jgi:hypothetical protein
VNEPSQSKWLSQNVAGAKHLELNAGTHYILVENWDEVNEAVKYYLRNMG